MSAFTQTLSDAKLILSTDRRLWAIAAFLFVSLFVWLITTPWRELPPEVPEEYVNIRVEDAEFRSLVSGVGKGFQQAAIERKELMEEVERSSHSMQTQQQEIDWHVDSLVDKMSTVADKLDKLTNRLGEQTIQKSKIDERLKTQKSGTRKKVQLDSSGY